jgi:hypothetical protein
MTEFSVGFLVIYRKIRNFTSSKAYMFYRREIARHEFFTCYMSNITDWRWSLGLDDSEDSYCDYVCHAVWEMSDSGLRTEQCTIHFNPLKNKCGSAVPSFI